MNLGSTICSLAIGVILIVAWSISSGERNAKTIELIHWLRSGRR